MRNLRNLLERKSRKNGVQAPPAEEPVTDEPLDEAALGLDIWVRGIDPVVDIVAIHGLNGHREKTWTAKNGVNWLRDPNMLPAIIPNARIMSWGYDANTHSTKELSGMYLYDHARNLVSDLSLYRRLDKTETRPIIFVAHSLGGIVLKSALIHADSARSEHLLYHRAIKTSTYSIIFMGTPHQGGEGVVWGKRLVNLVNILQLVDFETKFAFETKATPLALGQTILVVPKSSAVMLGQIDTEAIAIMDNHVNMVKFSSPNNDFRRVSGHLKLMAEKAPMKVQENCGSILPASFNFRAISQSHNEIPKQNFHVHELVSRVPAFAERRASTSSRKTGKLENPLTESKDLFPEIFNAGYYNSKPLDFAENALKTAPKTTSEENCILTFECLSAMDLAQHFYETNNADGKTFHWIHSTPSFITLASKSFSGAWLITGKPGCGKSVLSKSLYNTFVSPRADANTETRKSHNSETIKLSSFPISPVIFYAFNERVDGRRRAVNALSSLIAQLFRYRIDHSENLPKEVMGQFTLRFKEHDSGILMTPIWTRQELSRMLYSILTSSYTDFGWSTDVICIIDALDECILKTERRELLDCIERIGNHSGEHTVKFIVTSRPYPDICFYDIEPLKLDLDSEDFMDIDVASYAAEKVAALIKARPRFKAYESKILARIQSRADKMYLLVKLLVDMVLNMRDSSPRALEELLNALPTTLAEIYDNIWTHIGDDGGDRAKVFFSWVLCAFRPMNLEEFARFIATYDYLSIYNSGIDDGLANCLHDLASTGNNIIKVTENMTFGRRMSDYQPVDVEGDLKRLLGPLIQINPALRRQSLHSPQNPDKKDGFGRELSAHGLSDFEDEIIRDESLEGKKPEDASSMQYEVDPDKNTWTVRLCHQSVRDHFKENIPFLDFAEVHRTMAELGARTLDGMVSNDPDTRSVDTDTYNFDGQTFDDGRGGDLTYPLLYWARHRSMAVKRRPSLEGKIRLLKYSPRSFMT